MSNPDAIYSSDFYKEYASVSADIDLVAESQSAETPSVLTAGSYCRAISNAGAAPGTIAVIRARDGATVSLTFQAGEHKVIRARKILAAGTTVSPINVYW